MAPFFVVSATAPKDSSPDQTGIKQTTGHGRNAIGEPQMTNQSGELARRMLQSTKQSPFFAKDMAKAAKASTFIGQGSPASSTEAYRIACGDLANRAQYSAADVVFISSEGNRRGRFSPIVDGKPNGEYRCLDQAITARATIMMDQPYDRYRFYNIGERQIEVYLISKGYQEASPGEFRPADR